MWRMVVDCKRFLWYIRVYVIFYYFEKLVCREVNCEKFRVCKCGSEGNYINVLYSFKIVERINFWYVYDYGRRRVRVNKSDFISS